MSKWSDVKIYDLSIPIGVNCPPWPTYEPVQMKFFKRLSSNGANGQLLTHSNHVGTHLDGPLPFDTSGRTVDQLELTKLVRPVVVVDRTTAPCCEDFGIYTPDRPRSALKFARAISSSSTPAIISMAGIPPRLMSSATWSVIPVLP